MKLVSNTTKEKHMKHISEIIEKELEKLEDFENNRPISDYFDDSRWESFLRRCPRCYYEDAIERFDDDFELEEIPY